VIMESNHAAEQHSMGGFSTARPGGTCLA
jgi:hypothetical protein